MDFINKLAEEKATEIARNIDGWIKNSLNDKKIGRIINYNVARKRLWVAKLLARSVNLTLEQKEGVDMETDYGLFYAGQVISRKTIPHFNIISS